MQDPFIFEALLPSHDQGRSGQPDARRRGSDRSRIKALGNDRPRETEPVNDVATADAANA
ncbi:hypothetical protein [Streptomyces sp. TRM70350]|uniref:hypothetical protein n=1 Tax=Streptomyces sp. TRM70350 TaxID=2856165 RepID=UPI001C4668CE|nr:hypothetical protein [Streptomyces sp. TRM70350]MBV7698639.1 hypothetical protein [Streptomyces sp. TRM70350]